MTGNPAPAATLLIPSPNAVDALGNGSGQAIQLGDVTGDGIPEILVPASTRDRLQSNTGAIFLWERGTAWSSTPAPTELYVPGAGADEYLTNDQ